MKKINSNRKGKAYERELAKQLREYGYTEARRSQQYCGDAGDCDVIGLPGIHIEAKRVEALSLYKAMEQAEGDARNGNIPTVWHRRNGKRRTIVAMYMEDFMELYSYREVQIEKALDLKAVYEKQR